ncbi:MAG: UvrD-helicase domain-containing protein, partial [Eubacterium sp.]|nr:UvrD-helicase domain-containing protein [Eubacterium sp.]
MAERRWTTEQEAVIDSRGQELLVSAAAGSGKTSVLVERIYSRVMDRK